MDTPETKWRVKVAEEDNTARSYFGKHYLMKCNLRKRISLYSSLKGCVYYSLYLQTYDN